MPQLTVEQEEELVELWRANRRLYDYKVSGYMDRHARARAEASIGRNFGLTGPQVGKKLKSMRTMFTRLLRPANSWDAPKKYTERQAWVLARLNFLKPFVTKKSSIEPSYDFWEDGVPIKEEEETYDEGADEGEYDERQEADEDEEAEGSQQTIDSREGCSQYAEECTEVGTPTAEADEDDKDLIVDNQPNIIYSSRGPNTRTSKRKCEDGDVTPLPASDDEEMFPSQPKKAPKATTSYAQSSASHEKSNTPVPTGRGAIKSSNWALWSKKNSLPETPPDLMRAEVSLLESMQSNMNQRMAADTTKAMMRIERERDQAVARAEKLATQLEEALKKDPPDQYDVFVANVATIMRNVAEKATDDLTVIVCKREINNALHKAEVACAVAARSIDVRSPTAKPQEAWSQQHAIHCAPKQSPSQPTKSEQSTSDQAHQASSPQANHQQSSDQLSTDQPTPEQCTQQPQPWFVPVLSCTDLLDEKYDGVVVVTDRAEKLSGGLEVLGRSIEQYRTVDAACEDQLSVIYCSDLPSKRLVFSPTGPLNRDYDDVRRFQDAAEKGIKRALAAGCRSPLLVRPEDDSFLLATRVAAFGALQALYVPLDVRDLCPDKAAKGDQLGVWCSTATKAAETARIAGILENGRYVYRDIGGSDPERTAAPRVADYVMSLFKDTCIKVDVLSDPEVMEREYPMLSAVNRACKDVKRHTARILFLEYEGEGPIDTTLMLVGKGITYDTGGMDIKTGGGMIGMHRDKCGAAFVAGFFQVLSEWKPKGLKVIGTMCMVRNSVGPEGYVADEIIVSRAGKRVRIGNTDAEGRMVMSDLLCLAKEKAPKEVNPQLFTIATLTGHVVRAYSDHYTAVMSNGPASQAGIPQKLQEAGDVSGDMFEVSTIRREDYAHHTGPTEYEDVQQSYGGGSSNTARGHQAPAAFIIMASGLDKHGIDSDIPLKYIHLDIAGSSGPFPGTPTGAPIVAMSHAYVLNRESGAAH